MQPASRSIIHPFDHMSLSQTTPHKIEAISPKQAQRQWAMWAPTSWPFYKPHLAGALQTMRNVHLAWNRCIDKLFALNTSNSYFSAVICKSKNGGGNKLQFCMPFSHTLGAVPSKLHIAYRTCPRLNLGTENSADSTTNKWNLCSLAKEKQESVDRLQAG